MTLKIRTVRGIFFFAAIVAGIAVIAAYLIGFVVFPRETHAESMWRVVVVAVLVSVPILMFVGAKIHDNTLLADKLKNLVNRDRLTDIATREFFFRRLADMPGSYGVSLMIDIDDFKLINDTYGHMAGDDVIRDVAHVLRDEMRENDIVCRFGGEEFIVFLTDATPQRGLVIAERLRRAIEDLKTQSEGVTIAVTVSVGGSMKDQLDHIDQAIRRADECLYRAKAAGRNQTVVDWAEKWPSPAKPEAA